MHGRYGTWIRERFLSCGKVPMASWLHGAQGAETSSSSGSEGFFSSAIRSLVQKAANSSIAVCAGVGRSGHDGKHANERVPRNREADNVFYAATAAAEAVGKPPVPSPVDELAPEVQLSPLEQSLLAEAREILARIAAEQAATSGEGAVPSATAAEGIDEALESATNDAEDRLVNQLEEAAARHEAATLALAAEVAALGVVATADAAPLAAEAVQPQVTAGGAATAAVASAGAADAKVDAAGGASSAGSAEARAARFLQSLQPDVAAAVERARAVFIEAGGVADTGTDVVLARCVVQNSLNAKKIAAQLRRTIKWRETSGANRYRHAFLSGQPLLSFPSAELYLSVVPFYPACGLTLEGHLIAYSPPVADTKRFMKELTEEQFLEGCLVCNEFMYANMDLLTLERGDGQLVRMFFVSDLSYATLAHISPSVVKRLEKSAPVFDLYYPCWLSTTVTLHVPGFIASFWKLFQVILSEELRTRIKLFPKPAKGESSSKRLLPYMPPHLIPANYGGQMRTLLPEHMRTIGFDRFDGEALRRLCPGPVPSTKGVGRLHLPPDAQ